MNCFAILKIALQNVLWMQDGIGMKESQNAMSREQTQFQIASKKTFALKF